MSNLADLVLAAEEPDLEDPLLQEELARLQARRAATPPVTASFSRPTSARPTSARVASQVEKPVAQRLGWEEELSYSQSNTQYLRTKHYLIYGTVELNDLP